MCRHLRTRRGSVVPWTDNDKKLAEQISSYWVNFATTGDPNGKDLPKWNAYSVKDDQLMGFADAPAMTAVPHKAALDFLDGANEKARASGTAGRRQTAQR
jgi:para-nitrobenzyl esterase